MRTTVFALTTATAIVSAGTLIHDRAGAAPIRGPAEIRRALDDINPVERAACWTFGWRGWGWYPFCGPPPPPPPPVAWVPPPPEAWAYSPKCRDETVRERHGNETVVRHYHQCY